MDEQRELETLLDYDAIDSIAHESDLLKPFKHFTRDSIYRDSMIERDEYALKLADVAARLLAALNMAKNGLPPTAKRYQAFYDELKELKVI